MRYLIILLFFSFQSFAQINFNPYFKKLNLVTSKINVAEVIDARIDKDFTFISQDSVQKLETNGPLNLLIQEFINSSLPVNNKKNQIVIKINDFQFGSRMDEKKTVVWLYTDMEFFKKTDIGYIKIGDINDCKEAKNIDNLEIAINRLHWKLWNNILDDIEVKLKHINKNAIIDEKEVFAKAQVPNIFYDSTTIDGIYPYFNNMLYNTPVKLDFSIKEKSNQYYLVIKDQVKNKDKTEIWGVCKEGKIYKIIKNSSTSSNVLIPVKRFGNTFELTNENTGFMAKNFAFQKNKYGINTLNLNIANLVINSLSKTTDNPSAFLAIKIASDIWQASNIERILIDKNTGLLNPVETYKNLE